MSDKRKLHYYFTTKSTFPNETYDTHQITPMDKDVDTNEISVLNEINSNSLTSSSSSTITWSDSRNQTSADSSIEDDLTMTTTSATEDNPELSSADSQLHPYKR